MKNNKFNVQWLKEDGSVDKQQEFKSFKAIESALNLDYHVIRELHKITDGKVQKKFTHDNLKKLSKKLKILSINNINI
jgi:hypothetical protein